MSDENTQEQEAAAAEQAAPAEEAPKGRPAPFSQRCHDLRGIVGKLAEDVRGLLDHERFDAEEDRPGQYSEVKANLMLAVRHLEDARMRLGKAVQHIDDGVSVYDKP